MRALESALALLPPFRGLRPDERLRIAARFQQIPLEPGESWQADAPRLVLLVEGEARLDGRPLEHGHLLEVAETIPDLGLGQALQPLAAEVLDDERCREARGGCSLSCLTIYRLHFKLRGG